MEDTELTVVVGVLMMSELVGIHALLEFVAEAVALLFDPVAVGEAVEVALEAGAAEAVAETTLDVVVVDAPGRIPPKSDEITPVRAVEVADALTDTLEVVLTVKGATIEENVELSPERTVLLLRALVDVAVTLDRIDEAEPVRRLPRPRPLMRSELIGRMSESDCDAEAVAVAGAIVTVDDTTVPLTNIVSVPLTIDAIDEAVEEPDRVDSAGADEVVVKLATTPEIGRDVMVEFMTTGIGETMTLDTAPPVMRESDVLPVLDALEEVAVLVAAKVAVVLAIIEATEPVLATDEEGVLAMTRVDWAAAA